jgi:hypothetical protein
MATVRIHIDSGLVKKAKSAALVADRPITAQIEHWAKLGRILESVLTGASMFRVKQLGCSPSPCDALAASQTQAGQDKTRAVIFNHGMPTYSSAPDNPNLILERSPDGSVRSGRFVNRKFLPGS